jgi:Uma2 family endonuclease
MSSPTEVTMAANEELLMTVSDLDFMPEDGNRYEVIEGELFVSKAPGVPHQTVSMNLSGIFLDFLKLNPIGRVLATPGLIFDELSGVIPDLVFISNDRFAQIVSNERLIAAPDLIVEIVSPGSENQRRDRIAKRQLYGKFGVKEYWLVDLQNRVIEVLVIKDRILVPAATYKEDEEIRTPILPGFVCKASDVFSI